MLIVTEVFDLYCIKISININFAFCNLYNITDTNNRLILSLPTMGH